MGVFLKKHWPLLGLGVLLLFAASYLLKAGKDLIERPAAIEEALSGEGLKLKDMHYTQDDPDRSMKWTLDAKEVQFSEDRSSIVFHGFRLKLEPEGKATVTLTGKAGDYSRNTGVINLYGDLDAVSADGYRLITDYASFDEKARCLSSDKPVKITGPFFSVEGVGLFVDLNSRTFKVLSNVTTVIRKGAAIS